LEVLPFVLVTLLFLALPSLCVLLLGEKAKKALPKVRDWMNAQLLDRQRVRHRPVRRDHRGQPVSG